MPGDKFNTTLVCMIVILTSFVCVADQDYHKYFDMNAEGFVDPLDPLAAMEMESYPSNSSPSKSDQTTSSSIDGSDAEVPVAPPADYIHKSQCQCPKCPPTVAHEPANEDRGIDGGVYYRRFIHGLWRRLVRKVPNDLRDRRIALNVMLALEKSDVDSLRRFTEVDDANYQDVTDVLSGNIKRVSLASTTEMEQMDFDEIFGFNLTYILKCLAIITLVAVLTLCMTKFRLTMRTVGGLAIGLFLVSVPWDWMQLYRSAVARRQAELAMSEPDGCMPISGRSWSGALKWYVTSLTTLDDDPCTRFHQAHAVDPILDVSPLEAFTTTATKFFVNPLQYIGAGIAQFFNNVLRGLPFYAGFVIVLFIMLLIVLWLVMRMGYQIRAPFLLAGLERAPLRHEEKVLRVEGPVDQYQRYVQDVPREPLPSAVTYESRPGRYPAYLPPLQASGGATVSPVDDVITSDRDSRKSSSSSQPSNKSDIENDFIKFDPSEILKAEIPARDEKEVPPPKKPVAKTEKHAEKPESDFYPASLVIGTKDEIQLNQSGDHCTPDEKEIESPIEDTGAGDRSFDILPSWDDLSDLDLRNAPTLTESNSDGNFESLVIPVLTLKAKEEIDDNDAGNEEDDEIEKVDPCGSEACSNGN